MLEDCYPRPSLAYVYLAAGEISAEHYPQLLIEEFHRECRVAHRRTRAGETRSAQLHRAWLRTRRRVRRRFGEASVLCAELLSLPSAEPCSARAYGPGVPPSIAILRAIT
jgi:hypothetical protein